MNRKNQFTGYHKHSPALLGQWIRQDALKEMSQDQEQGLRGYLQSKINLSQNKKSSIQRYFDRVLNKLEQQYGTDKDILEQKLYAGLPEQQAMLEANRLEREKERKVDKDELAQGLDAYRRFADSFGEKDLENLKIQRPTAINPKFDKGTMIRHIRDLKQKAIDEEGNRDGPLHHRVRNLLARYVKATNQQIAKGLPRGQVLLHNKGEPFAMNMDSNGKVTLADKNIERKLEERAKRKETSTDEKIGALDTLTKELKKATLLQKIKDLGGKGNMNMSREQLKNRLNTLRAQAPASKPAPAPAPAPVSKPAPAPVNTAPKLPTDTQIKDYHTVLPASEDILTLLKSQPQDKNTKKLKKNIKSAITRFKNAKPQTKVRNAELLMRQAEIGKQKLMSLAASAAAAPTPAPATAVVTRTPLNSSTKKSKKSKKSKKKKNP